MHFLNLWQAVKQKLSNMVRPDRDDALKSSEQYDDLPVAKQIFPRAIFLLILYEVFFGELVLLSAMLLKVRMTSVGVPTPIWGNALLMGWSWWLINVDGLLYSTRTMKRSIIDIVIGILIGLVIGFIGHSTLNEEWNNRLFGIIGIMVLFGVAVNAFKDAFRTDKK